MTQTWRRGAWFALGVLTLLNLLNYADRWVISAVVEPIKLSLALNDAQIGFAYSGFIIVYTIASPLFGSLGDRKARPPVIALGVFLWSVATAAAGFARGFWSLFAARAGVGVGEAAYGTIAPPLLADHFPVESRGRALAVFFAAIPLGSAAGYVIGGVVDQHLGWRAAFWVVGVPGIVLALLILRIRDEGGAAAVSAADGVRHARRSTSSALFRNRAYLLSTFGYAAYTFALGGLAFWMPAFLERVRGMPRAQATVTFGAITVVTGFAGTFAGGWLADLLLRRNAHAYMWVSGVSALLAAPITYVALSNPNRIIYLWAIVIAQVLVFMSTGPVNSAIVSDVPHGDRATAMGLAILIIHLFGDIPSPTLIGAISDASSLKSAVLIVPVAILIAGSIWTYAAVSGK